MNSSQHHLQFVFSPYIHQPDDVSASVVWETTKKCFSWVEYGTTPELGQKGMPQSQHGLFPSNRKLHAIRLEALSPGTRYYYRAFSKEIVEFGANHITYGAELHGDIRTFKTFSSAKQCFSFVTLQDIHGKVQNFDRLMELTDWAGVDFVVLNGDMQEVETSPAEIKQCVITPSLKHFARDLPFFYIRGNHECRGPDAGTLIEYFPNRNGRYYYTFCHGNAHFTVMDSGEDKEDSHKEYSGLVDFDRYRDEQTQWLKQVAESEHYRSAAFRIALIHVPPYRVTDWHVNRFMQQHWVPIFNRTNLDLMISGHDHAYVRFSARQGKNQFVSVAGDTDTSIRTDIAPDSIHITVTRVDGELVDRFSVEKDRDNSLAL